MSYNTPVRRKQGGAVLEVASGGTAVAAGKIQVDDGGLLVGADGQQASAAITEFEFDFSGELGTYNQAALELMLSTYGIYINALRDLYRNLGVIP